MAQPLARPDIGAIKNYIHHLDVNGRSFLCFQLLAYPEVLPDIYEMVENWDRMYRHPMTTD